MGRDLGDYWWACVPRGGRLGLLSSTNIEAMFAGRAPSARRIASRASATSRAVQWGPWSRDSCLGSNRLIPLPPLAVVCSSEAVNADQGEREGSDREPGEQTHREALGHDDLFQSRLDRLDG